MILRTVVESRASKFVENQRKYRSAVEGEKRIVVNQEKDRLNSTENHIKQKIGKYPRMYGTRKEEDDQKRELLVGKIGKGMIGPERDL